MISLVCDIPHIYLPRAELVKINCNYNLYKDVALFWVQNDGQAVISLLDGNMTIYNINAQTEELRQFINVISPLRCFQMHKRLKTFLAKIFTVFVL